MPTLSQRIQALKTAPPRKPWALSGDAASDLAILQKLREAAAATASPGVEAIRNPDASGALYRGVADEALASYGGLAAIRSAMAGTAAPAPSGRQQLIAEIARSSGLPAVSPSPVPPRATALAAPPPATALAAPGRAAQLALAPTAAGRTPLPALSPEPSTRLAADRRRGTDFAEVRANNPKAGQALDKIERLFRQGAGRDALGLGGPLASDIYPADSLLARISRAKGASVDQPAPLSLSDRIAALRQGAASQSPAHPLLRGRRGTEQEQAGPPPIPQPWVGAGGPTRPMSYLASGGQGAVDVIASAPQSVAIQQAQRNARMAGYFNRIDAGEQPPVGEAMQDLGPSAATDVAAYLRNPDQRQELRDKYRVTDPRGTSLYQFGEELSQSARARMPTNPAFKGEFGEQLSRGIGSTVGFAFAGVLTRGVGMGPLFGAALTGAAAQSSDQFKDALSNGASLEDAYKAANLGAIVGTSEALPIARILDRLDKATGGQISRVIIEAAKSGAEEGLQELGQQVSSNLIASELVGYDQDRGTFQGAGPASGVGFTTGSLLSVLASMLGISLRHANRPDAPVTPEELTEGITATMREPWRADVTMSAERAGPPPAPEVSPEVPPPAAEAPVQAPAPQNNLPPDIPVQAYRGSGRAEQGAVYSGPSLPILGKGRYFSFSREGAERFGPQVEQETLAFRNPLVIRSDEQWRALTQEAGWRFPNPFGLEAGEVEAATDRLSRIVRERAHDGVIVYWDDSTDTDTDASGNSIKTLRNVFGEPQAFEPAGSAPPPAMPGAIQPGPSAAVPPGAPQEAPQPPAESPTIVPPPATPGAATPPLTGPVRPGKRSVAVTPRGRRVDVELAVVPASQLRTSHNADLARNPDYPAELQPRERARAASQAQISNIAADLKPELLGDTGSAADGAPIIGPDSVVESGNARTLAIQEAYRKGKAGPYRQWLKDQGFDIEGMTAPVLVRRRTTDLSPQDRQAFTREANERTTLSMGASEQAMADADAMPDWLMPIYRGGSLNAASNRDFVRRFVESAVPPSEQGAVFTTGGGLSQQGLARVENAVFGKAYGDAALLESLREDTDTNVKAIGSAMIESAPRWAQLRARVRNGAVPNNLDITDSLLQAVRLVSQSRRQGLPIRDLVAQGDMFGQRADQTTRNILDILFRDENWRSPQSSQRIAQALDYYADQALRAEGGADLLGERTTDPSEILLLAKQGGQATLEGAAGPTTGARVPRAPLRANERMVRTAAGESKAIFPDPLHAALYDLGATGDRAEARRIYDQLKGYIFDDPKDAGGRFRNASDVISLARDYREDVEGVAEANVKYRGGKPEYQGFVIDPDRQTRYLMRDRLGKTEAEMGDVSYSPDRSELERSQSTGQPNEFEAPSIAKLQGADETLGELPETAAMAPTSAMAGPGKNWVGSVKDQEAGTSPGKVFRREDILRPLLKDLGVPLYQGRMKQRKWAGFYRRRIEEVRVKADADMETAAHELAHLLDDRFPEIRKQWHPATNKNKIIREELKGVSYDKSKVYEGFAEFVRLWSTQADAAEAKAPNFFAWFEGFLDSNQHGPAFRRAQKEMHEWFAQSGIARARSKIGKAKGINAALTGFWDKARQAIFDDLHGVLRMERQLTGGLSPAGPYVTARLLRGNWAFIEGTLLYGAPVIRSDGSHGYEGKSLSDILEPVADNLEDFILYAVGRSAGELMSQGRERLFTPAEVKAMQKLETPERKQAFEEYQDWNSAILDFAEAKGVIDPKKRAAWRRSQYLPFYRVGTSNSLAKGSFSQPPGDWKGIKRLSGGTGNLQDILGNMVGNASMILNAALTNEARLRVAKLAQGPKGAHFMAKIPKESQRAQAMTFSFKEAALDAFRAALTVEETQAIREGNMSALEIGERSAEKMQAFEELAEDFFDGLPGSLNVLTTPMAPKGSNVVAVLKGGEPEYYEVIDPLLYSALTHFNRPARDLLIEIIGMPKQLGQATITLTLDFMLANMARDTVMGSIMSRHGFKPFVDSARGMASRVKVDQNYKDFVANGGGYSSVFLDESAFRHRLRRFSRKKGFNLRNVLDTPANFWHGYERLADAFEMSTRLGEYRRAIRAGEHPRQAAYLGREVSTDFGLRGDSAAIGFLFDTIIFLKAAMNGMDRLYRGVVHDPNRRAIAARSALLALASVGLYLLNRGNPEYEDLEDWERDVYWHFFVPTPEAMEAYASGRKLPKNPYIHLRYPKIWEIGAIASTAERTVQRLLDGQPGELAEDAWRILTDVFRVEYIPQFAAPLYELAINRNRFTDRPIETQAMQEMQPWARSHPYGSRSLRWLGEQTRGLPEALQFSPAKAEALLRGYGNTFAHYGLQLSDAVFFDDIPSLRADQYPVIRRFYSGSPNRHSRYVTELYDMIEEATEARRTLRYMDRTYRREFAEELADTPANISYGQMNLADQTMRNFNQAMRQVVNIPALPELQRFALSIKAMAPTEIGQLRLSKSWNDLPLLKRDLLEAIGQQKNAYAKEVVQSVEAASQ